MTNEDDGRINTFKEKNNIWRCGGGEGRRSLVAAHLVGHEVGQQHHVAPVDAHSVVHHGVLDLVDDGGASRLDAQRLLHLLKHGPPSTRKRNQVSLQRSD